MDRSKNNSSEFGNRSLATTNVTSTTNSNSTAPWNNKETTLPNEDDSNEDDADTATPAKVTDPLAPKFTNNEVGGTLTRQRKHNLYGT